MKSKFLKFSEVRWLDLSTPNMEWDLLTTERTKELLEQCESLMDDAVEIQNVRETFIEEIIQCGENPKHLPTICQKFLDMITPEHKVFQQVWEEETVWLLVVV